MLRHITGLVMLLTSINVFSQNIETSTIEWNVASTFDARQGVVVDDTTRIVSSSDQIVWYATDGNVRKTMTIADNIGTWTNVSSNGLVTFNITSEDSSGIVQFWRTSGQAKVRIHLIGAEGEEIYELAVSNFIAH